MTDGQSEQLDSNRELMRQCSDSLPAQRPLPTVFADVLGSMAGACWHNFRGDKMQVYKMVAMARGPDVQKFDPGKPCDMLVQNIYLQGIELVDDKTGEITPAVRCVFISPDCQCIGFASDTIAKDVALLIQTFGEGPYDPPLPLTVRQFRTARNRVAYSLQPNY